MKKKRVMILLLGVMLGLALPVLATTPDVRVYVDEVEVAFPDQQPLINADNRTLVPLRFVSQALGGKVEWFKETKTVEIKHAGETILLTVGERFARKGQEKITLDTTATIMGDRTMVPLRYVSECLGAHVYWNGTKRKVFITTKLPPVNEFVGIPFKPSDLPFKGGSRPLERSDLPSARIQYVKPSELPVKLKDSRIIYNLTVDEKYIYIKQYSKLRLPLPLYMVEDGQLNRGRRYTSDLQESVVFTFKYPVQSRLEQATGEKPVNLSEISGFTLHTITDEGFRMLVIENPLYLGGE
ncbi:MAG: copper amine oxidase N-terminal domain-containing protein [Peptococcia bacterium]|jgi:hypothetical protein